MKKIKENMYVKIKSGIIAKIEVCLGKDEGYHNMENYRIDTLVKLPGQKYNFVIYEEDIIDANEDITVLLKIGDIITVFSDLHDRNGNQTLNIVDNNHLRHLKLGFEEGYFHLINVISKEYFNNVIYKVK